MHYAIISIISSILGLGNLEGSDFPAPVDHFWATLTKSCPAMTVSVFAFICRSWPLSGKTNRLWKQQWVYLILTLGKRYSSLRLRHLIDFHFQVRYFVKQAGKCTARCLSTNRRRKVRTGRTDQVYAMALAASEARHKRLTSLGNGQFWVWLHSTLSQKMY